MSRYVESSSSSGTRPWRSSSGNPSPSFRSIVLRDREIAAGLDMHRAQAVATVRCDEPDAPARPTAPCNSQDGEESGHGLPVRTPKDIHGPVR